MSISIQDRVTLAALDFDLTCQTSGPAHRAELAVVCRTCGDVTYYCQAHHFTVLDWVRRRLDLLPEAVIACPACEHEEHTHTACFRVMGII